MGSKPILQTKSKDSSGGRASGEKARASVVRLISLHNMVLLVLVVARSPVETLGSVQIRYNTQ